MTITEPAPAVSAAELALLAAVPAARDPFPEYEPEHHGYRDRGAGGEDELRPGHDTIPLAPPPPGGRTEYRTPLVSLNVMPLLVVHGGWVYA